MTALRRISQEEASQCDASQFNSASRLLRLVRRRGANWGLDSESWSAICDDGAEATFDATDHQGATASATVESSWKLLNVTETLSMSWKITNRVTIHLQVLRFLTTKAPKLLQPVQLLKAPESSWMWVKHFEWKAFETSAVFCRHWCIMYGVLHCNGYK